VSSFVQHERGVAAMEFSEDGTHLVTVSSDRHLKVLDCSTQKNIIDIGPADDGMVTVSKKKKAKASADGAAAGPVSKGKTKKSLVRVPQSNPHQTPISSVNVCSDTMIATGDDDGLVALWDMRQQRPSHVYHEHGDYVSQMLFFSEVNQLVSCSGDTCVGCFDLRANRIIDYSEPRKDELTCMTFIPATNDLICGTPCGTLPVWKYGSWARPHDVHKNHPKECDALTTYNDNIFFSGACDGVVRVIQHYPTRRVLTHLGGLDRRRFGINHIRISHDRNLLAVSGQEKFVQFLDISFLSDESQLDKLRTRAEVKHMETIRESNAAKQKKEEGDADSDSDDSDDSEAPREKKAKAAQRRRHEGSDSDEEDDGNTLKGAGRAEGGIAKQRVVSDDDDDDEPEMLDRQTKRARVAAAKWLKDAQKQKVDFKRERGKKRTSGFWSDLTN
jgi:hypothetical protein